MSQTRIFGFTEDAPLKIVTLSFICITAYLILAEHVLSRINKLAEDTCYCNMVQHLYKDLTITGVLSFVLAMLLATESLSASTHIIYLEIAELTLFFATIYHVLFSAVWILSNTSYLNYLNEKLDVDPVDLTNEFKALSAFEQSPWCFWRSGIRNDLELRVFRIVFHSHYKLARNFDYAKYLALCQEVNIMNLLKVNPAHWLSFFVLLGVNYLWTAYFQGSEMEIAFVRRRFCENSDNVRTCTNVTAQIFLFSLVVLFYVIVAACLAFASRQCEFNILTAAGPKNPSEYKSYILKDEKSDLEKSDHQDRMSWKELKKHIEVLKTTDVEDGEENVLEIIPRRLSDGTKKLWSSARDLMKTVGATAKVGSVQIFEDPSINKSTFLYSDVAPSTNSDPEGDERHTVSYNARGSILSAPSYKVEHEADIEGGEAYKLQNSESKKSTKSAKSSKSSKLLLGLSQAERKLDIFLFGSPKLYYFLRGSTSWSFCIALAFYTTTFGPLSMKSENPVIWNIIIVGLLLACGSCQYYTIRSSSFIYAFSKLDTDVIGRVIEENEERSELERNLRKKLSTKLQNAVGEQYKETKMAVMHLFAEIKALSEQSDGYISKRELQLLLQRLDIHFSVRRFNETFRLLDKNLDGKIGLKELYDFIYPERANQAHREVRKARYRASVGISIKNFSQKGSAKARNKSIPLPVFKPHGGRRASLAASDLATFGMQTVAALAPDESIHSGIARTGSSEKDRNVSAQSRCDQCATAASHFVSTKSEGSERSSGSFDHGEDSKVRRDFKHSPHSSLTAEEVLRKRFATDESTVVMRFRTESNDSVDSRYRVADDDSQRAASPGMSVLCSHTIRKSATIELHNDDGNPCAESPRVIPEETFTF